MKSFFSRLKVELIYAQQFLSIEEAKPSSLNALKCFTIACAGIRVLVMLRSPSLNERQPWLHS